MCRERHFDKSNESRITPLPGNHLLTHHSRMAGAEEENQPALCDTPGADLRSFFDLRKLAFTQAIQECPGFLKINRGSAHRRPIVPSLTIFHLPSRHKFRVRRLVLRATRISL